MYLKKNFIRNKICILFSTIINVKIVMITSKYFSPVFCKKIRLCVEIHILLRHVLIADIIFPIFLILNFANVVIYFCFETCRRYPLSILSACNISCHLFKSKTPIEQTVHVIMDIFLLLLIKSIINLKEYTDATRLRYRK